MKSKLDEDENKATTKLNEFLKQSEKQDFMTTSFP